MSVWSKNGDGSDAMARADVKIPNLKGEIDPKLANHLALLGHAMPSAVRAAAVSESSTNAKALSTRVKSSGVKRNSAPTATTTRVASSPYFDPMAVAMVLPPGGSVAVPIGATKSAKKDEHGEDDESDSEEDVDSEDADDDDDEKPAETKGALAAAIEAERIAKAKRSDAYRRFSSVLRSGVKGALLVESRAKLAAVSRSYQDAHNRLRTLEWKRGEGARLRSRA